MLSTAQVDLEGEFNKLKDIHVPIISEQKKKTRKISMISRPL